MNHIQELRESKGMSQTIFGNEFGISQQTVSRIERDPTQMATDLLIKMAHKFNVTTDYLLELSNVKRNLFEKDEILHKIDEHYDIILDYEELDSYSRNIFRIVLKGIKEAQMMENKDRNDG